MPAAHLDRQGPTESAVLALQRRLVLWSALALWAIAISSLISSSAIKSSLYHLSSTACPMLDEFCPPVLNHTHLSSLERRAPPGAELAHPSIRYLDRPTLSTLDTFTTFMNDVESVLEEMPLSDEDKSSIKSELLDAKRNIISTRLWMAEVMDNGLSYLDFEMPKGGVLLHESFREFTPLQLSYIKAFITKHASDLPAWQQKILQTELLVILSNFRNNVPPALTRREPPDGAAHVSPHIHKRLHYRFAKIRSHLEEKQANTRPDILKRILCFLRVTQSCRLLGLDLQFFDKIDGAMEYLSEMMIFFDDSLRMIPSRSIYLSGSTDQLLGAYELSPKEGMVTSLALIYGAEAMRAVLRALNGQAGL